MAALLVSLAVMSVLMTAVLPAWRHQAKREKEAELVFRGEQYVRAIRLWEMKMGPGSRPPTFDMMVQQKFLRKKYKDPMSPDGEFQPLFAGANIPQPGSPQPGGRGRGPSPQQPPPQSGGFGPQPGAVGQAGGAGILGVASKSKEASIRIYNGGAHYNEWRFIYASASSAPGGRGVPNPGGRGGSPMPGGRGPDGRGIGLAAASAQVAAASAQAAGELDRAGKDPEVACRHFRRAGGADGSRRLGTSGTGLRRGGTGGWLGVIPNGKNAQNAKNAKSAGPTLVRGGSAVSCLSRCLQLPLGGISRRREDRGQLRGLG